MAAASGRFSDRRSSSRHCRHSARPHYLYVPARILDLAESLAEKAGVPSIQDYCGLLLMRAIENERVREKVANIELRRGPLEGLNEIADDPHYLAEWQQRAGEKAEPPAGAATTDAPIFIEPQPTVKPLPIEVIYPERKGTAYEAPAPSIESEPTESEREPDRMQIRVVPATNFAAPRARQANGKNDERPIRCRNSCVPRRDG